MGTGFVFLPTLWDGDKSGRGKKWGKGRAGRQNVMFQTTKSTRGLWACGRRLCCLSGVFVRAGTRRRKDTRGLVRRSTLQVRQRWSLVLTLWMRTWRSLEVESLIEDNAIHIARGMSLRGRLGSCFLDTLYNLSQLLRDLVVLLDLCILLRYCVGHNICIYAFTTCLLGRQEAGYCPRYSQIGCC